MRRAWPRHPVRDRETGALGRTLSPSSPPTVAMGQLGSLAHRTADGRADTARTLRGLTADRALVLSLVFTGSQKHKAVYCQVLEQLILCPPAATKFENESERLVREDNRSSGASEPQVAAWKETTYEPCRW